MGGMLSETAAAKAGRKEAGVGSSPAWTQDRFAERHIGPDTA
jgi:hypothetical protein